MPRFSCSEIDYECLFLHTVTLRQFSMTTLFVLLNSFKNFGFVDMAPYYPPENMYTNQALKMRITVKPVLRDLLWATLCLTRHFFMSNVVLTVYGNQTCFEGSKHVLLYSNSSKQYCRQILAWLTKGTLRIMLYKENGFISDSKLCEFKVLSYQEIHVFFVILVAMSNNIPK